MRAYSVVPRRAYCRPATVAASTWIVHAICSRKTRSIRCFLRPGAQPCIIDALRVVFRALSIDTANCVRSRRACVVAKFHYTGPTGPARTFLRPGSRRNSVGSVRISDKVRAGPRVSGRARVVAFSLHSAPVQ